MCTTQRVGGKPCVYVAFAAVVHTAVPPSTASAFSAAFRSSLVNPPRSTGCALLPQPTKTRPAASAATARAASRRGSPGMDTGMVGRAGLPSLAEREVDVPLRAAVRRDEV